MHSVGFRSPERAETTFDDLFLGQGTSGGAGRVGGPHDVSFVDAVNRRDVERPCPNIPYVAGLEDGTD
ncbi:hypothetical protein BIU97_09015 [Curtobacterium sp. MCBA15_009]|nr:hypothetical protein BIU97_09015 [Curtobacterium sp. MCBA15_009]